eukprot:393096_1
MAQHLATTKCNRDVDSDDDTLHLRICINKQYFLTENIDPRNDVWKSGELDENALNLDGIRDEIPLAFRTKKPFKRLFADTNQWQWTVYEYGARNASIPIEKSLDLRAYIHASISSISDSEGHEKYLKLRIVFRRSETTECKSVSSQQPVNHDVSNTIPCDTCGQRIPFNEYTDHQFVHSIDSTYVTAAQAAQVCDNTSTNSTNKNQSNETHTSNDIPCERCGKSVHFFEYQEHQLQHLYSIQNPSQPEPNTIENKANDDIDTVNDSTGGGINNAPLIRRYFAANDGDDHKEDAIVLIPTEFKDPITNKIMQSPTMIVSSSQVYDEITIKEMIKSQRTHDVITGVPFSIGGWPLLLEYRMDIQSRIDAFLKENALNKAQVMNKSDANAFPWELLFEKHEHKIEEEVAEIVRDQSELQHSAKQIFKPLNEQKDEKEEKQPPPNDKKKELLQKAHQLYYKVSIKNRRFFFTKHENCFVGSEAVSAIMDLGFAHDEDSAVAFGNKLMQYDIIWHVDMKQSFKNDNEWYRFVEDMSRISDNDPANNCSGIDYDSSILLQPDIPVVCVMGPSRNGKSTIVNDILGVKDACKVSSRANVASTKGAWIAKYSHTAHDGQRKEFYLLDMEGLSHNVTKFTKQLFYACYATANVVIWNDMEIMADRFVKLMKSLQKELEIVACSDHKPAFLYLKRDAGDYDYSPYDSLHHYINKDHSFKWFRDMNIFASFSGYELNRPTPDKNNKKGILNFQSKRENRALLTPLIETIVGLCTESHRFASDAQELQTQINHINDSTALNMTEILIADNEVLNLFALSSENDSNYRRSEMIYVACEFSWRHSALDDIFTEQLKNVKKTLGAMGQIDFKAIEMLEKNKKEIYQRIKNSKRIVDGHLAFRVGTLGLYSAAVITSSIVTGGVATVAWLGISALSLAGHSGWMFKYKNKKKGNRQLGKFVTGNALDFSLGEMDEKIKKCP